MPQDQRLRHLKIIMEIWDLYDENRRLTGKTHIRGQEIPKGCYHLVVHVWMRNKKGEYLMSLRSASRPTYPLMWECVGGSVIAGEDSYSGALRETLEEVGIDLSETDGRVVFSRTRGVIGGKVFGDIMDVWLFEYDGKATLERATTDEVSEIKWMTRKDIEALSGKQILVPTLEYFFNEIDK